MKIKILVIFFLALIMSFIIYNVTLNNRKSILILGDNHLLDSNYKAYDKYLYDNFKDDVVFFNELFTDENKTYKDIINDIKNNKYIVFKNKNVYLNQLISKANIIILNANNSEYFKKCNKSKSIIEEYNKKISNDIDSLIKIINKISTSKIIVIGNYCLNGKDYSSYYSRYNYINMNELVSNNENISSFRTFKLSNEGNFTLYKYVKSIKNNE